MPKRLKIEGYPRTDELEKRYREAHDPVERSHYQIIWLLSRGKLTREVTEATGYTAPWIREVARRYNEAGEEGVGDRRLKNPGGGERALLDAEQREELGRVLQTPPEDGGMWNSRKVAEWIREKTGRGGVRAQRGWEYLGRLDYTPQRPRPSRAKADAGQQEEFRGN